MRYALLLILGSIILGGTLAGIAAAAGWSDGTATVLGLCLALVIGVLSVPYYLGRHRKPIATFTNGHRDGHDSTLVTAVSLSASLAGVASPERNRSVSDADIDIHLATR